jgi:glyoxylase-like metal-dependent hydrolase (beta-lactamase superfamily II)
MRPQISGILYRGRRPVGPLLLGTTEAGHLAGWFETTAFENGIVRIREPGVGPLDACNIWLIVGSKASLLVDTGIGVAPLAPVVSALSDRRLICLLTHSHYDHIGGAHEFPERYIHAAEADVLANPTPQATLWRGWLTPQAFKSAPSPDFRFEAYGVKPAPPAGVVAGGEEIDLGDRRIEIVHTPGHSPGLVSAFERTTGTLFTSDALYDGPMFFDLPRSDRQEGKRSIARLAALRAQTIHPGHFESFGAERLNELAQRQVRA